jgi:hypothetical protein
MIRAILAIFLVLISCQSQVTKTNKDPEPVVTPEITLTPLNKNHLNWIDDFPKNIKAYRSQFYTYDVGSFNCSIIDQFYSDFGTKLNTKNLVPFDSVMTKSLFGLHESEYGPFTYGYLYSIEKPFMDFYPITVIYSFGVDDRPVLLVLFDSIGRFVNSIEVANSYGEGGGCLSSRFINDSTILRDYEWNEYELDSLGYNQVGTAYSSEQLIIRKNGTFIVEK